MKERMAAELEAERMRLLASQYRQMGFLELAKFLQKNAADALRCAGQGETEPQ